MRTRVTATVVALVAALPGFAQQIHRNDLGQQLQFLPGPSNTRHTEVEHSVSTEYAHKGTASELIAIESEVGAGADAPFIHYVYPTPRAPVGPGLACSVWVKSKQPGIQLRVRVVLPRVANPQKPGQAHTVLLDGDFFKYADNWQKLEFGNFEKMLKDRQQTLRLELNRDVDLTGAYVDQIVLNLYTGPGRVRVWVDELEIGPVTDDRPLAPVKPDAPDQLPTRPHGGLVEINRDQLKVDGKRLFPRFIRYSDTPLETLKRAGLHMLVLEPGVSAAVVEEAVRREFYLVPTLSVAGLDARPPTAFQTALPAENPDTLGRFLNNDRVLFWYLGGGRSAEQLDKVAQMASLVRESDPQRPLGVDAWDGLWPYSRNVDMIGFQRWPLMSMDLLRYRDWLDQRRRLARPGTFTWNWVQTHAPEWYTSLVYDRAPSATFDEPLGPLPEQVRLMTYLSVASGTKGIGYWSDRFLADSHHGRDRLLAVALLNQELDMLEPVLLGVNRSPIWIGTSNENVKAAVLQGDRGTLVIPVWLGGGAQFVPGQAATGGLTMTVPMIPDTYQPWEVSPGRVRSLKPKTVTGGTQITLPEFGLAAAVVFTGDLSDKGMLVYWQKKSRVLGPDAAQYAYDLATNERNKVVAVTRKLDGLAPPITGARDLLADTDNRLNVADAHLRNRDYAQAYMEAQRALRPLRILMRLQWEQATSGLITTTASPYAVSYYTLPRQWEFMAAIQRAAPGANLLTWGGFEGQPDKGWATRQTTLDDVLMQARLSDAKAKEGKQFLELNVVPKPDPANPAAKPKVPDALERTFIAVDSPKVRVAPGTLVRISAWVRIPRAITASADGALLYDSVGGEPLAVRLTGPQGWQKYELYRRAPASGEVSVTLALSGIGTAQFDDVRIEPLLPPGGTTVLQK